MSASDVDERRKRYHSVENQSAQSKNQGAAGKRKREVILGSAMDDFINAGTRPGLSCRREVLNVYFENDKCGESDIDYPHGVILTMCIDPNTFKQCDTSTPAGCQRCAPKAGTVCCDLCAPTSDSTPMNDITNTNPTRRSIASRIKPVELGSRHHDLRMALLDWRMKTAVEKHNKMVVKRYGSQIIMSEAILDRLILCAHAQKITTAACIKRETQWRADYAKEYGSAVVAILHEHFPLAPPSIPLTSTAASATSSTTAEPVPKPKRVTTCSACGGKGHNRMLSFFYLSLCVHLER